jgi:hypothetical protein
MFDLVYAYEGCASDCKVYRATSHHKLIHRWFFWAVPFYRRPAQHFPGRIRTTRVRLMTDAEMALQEKRTRLQSTSKLAHTQVTPRTHLCISVRITP